MLKNIYICFLLFWEDAMFSLTERWKEVNIEAVEEIQVDSNDVPNGNISHVAMVSKETY